MGTKTILKVINIKKYYPVSRSLLSRTEERFVKAVDDISFTIEEGKTTAIVGESGCGKTTIAKVVLRLEKPTDGKVFLNGHNIHELRGAEYKRYRAQMQAVFQDPWSSLNPRMRVGNIIAEPLIINKNPSRKEVRKRVEEVLTDVGLNPLHIDRYPHEFSGGQRQRIAVASGLVSNPKVIVLDEPVSSLDVSIRAQIMNMFRDIQIKYNVSYMLIAHDLGTTRYMANIIGVMYLGKMVEYAATESIFEGPLHPYTKALFSAALPNHPDNEREEIILQGEVPSPLDPPSGCSFHPRCPMKIGEICEKKTPQVVDPEGKEHLVSCHLYR